MNVRLVALLAGSVLSPVAAHAETPPAVADLFRTAAEALANKDLRDFLDHFDPAMPGLAQLRDDVEGSLLFDVVSSIEIVNDSGDDKARNIELDWLLRIGDNRPRRVLVKCRVEHQGRSWKITRFEPIDFFRRG